MLKWLRRRWSEPVPEWAEPLGRFGYVAMLESLEAELDRRGFAFTRKDATIAIEQGGKLVLPTLVRQYVDVPPAAWRQHTEEVIDAATAPPRRKRPPRLGGIRKDLRVRLAANANGVVQRLLADGLHGVVVRKLEEGAKPLPAEVVAGPDRDAVFDLALAQTDAELPADTTVVVNPAGMELWRELLGPYAATAALRLDRYLAGSSARGAVVAVPCESVLLYRSLDCPAGTGLAAMTHLAAKVGEMYAAAEDPVSKGIFWWRDGRFARLDCTVDEKGEVHFRPGEEFASTVIYKPFLPPAAVVST